LHCGVCMLISAATVAVVLVVPIGGLQGPLLVMSMALPFMLLVWTARRLSYITSDAKVAAIGSLCYAAVVVGAALAASRLGGLSPGIAFAIMGLASIPATFVILARLSVSVSGGGDGASA